MKQLRASGIEKLLANLREDCLHLERLSRDDQQLVDLLEAVGGAINAAQIRVQDTTRERASA